MFFEFESPPVNAACALLLLFVEETVQLFEGFTCSNSHTKGQTQMGKGLFLEPRRCPTGLFPASPLAFASSSCSSLICLSLLQLLAFQLGTEASKQGQGVYTDALGAHFENHPQNH